MSGTANLQNTLFELFDEGLVLTLDQLAEAAGMDKNVASTGAGRLIVRGYIQRLQLGVYTLTEEGLDARQQNVKIKSGPMGPTTAIARAPERDTLRQRAWSAMRVLVTFSTAEIACIATDEPSENDMKNIRKYCRGLRSAGVLIDMPTRERGTIQLGQGHKRYRLFRELGEIAPSHRAHKNDVFDHNSREVLPCQA